MEEQEFNLRSVLGALRRQLWIIVLTVVVVVGLSAVVILSLEPIYRATTLVLVDPSDKNLLDPSTGGTSSTAENARVESEVSIAKSESTLGLVIDKLALQDDPDFQPRESLRDQILRMLRIIPAEEYTAEDRRNSALSRLGDVISIERQGLTYLITVSANASSPSKAALLADTMAEMYIRAQLESKVNSVLAGRDILQTRVEETRLGLVQSEQAFSDFIISSAASIAASTGRTDLDDLRVELENSVAGSDRLSSTVDLAESSLAQNDWERVAQTLETQSLREIRQRMQDIEQQLADAVDGSETHDDLQAQLLQLTEDFRGQAAAEIEQLRRQVADQRAQEADLQLQLRSAILTSNLPPEVLANMYELQQNAEIARTQYQQMLSRLRDVEAQAYLQLADSRIVSNASPPSVPAFPNTRFLLAASGFVAILLGIGLAMFRENFVGGIVSTDQLEDLSRSTVVASIPNQKRLGKDNEGKPVARVTDLVVAQPYSWFAEAVRRTMVTVDQALRRAQGSSLGEVASVILVTSANTGEGKTTTAVSLARAYALSGKSTILIDADLRRPAVHAELGINTSDALNRYLTQTGNGSKASDDISGITITDSLTPAKIVVGSAPSGTPTSQLVSSGRFARLLNKARMLHEVVILDTAPVGAIVDALYLSQYADVIVNVVRYASTSQREVRETLAELREAKPAETEIVCVLNAEDQSKGQNRRRFGHYYAK